MLNLKKTTSVIKTIRSDEWWEFKIATFFGTAYATAVIAEIPIGHLPLYLVFLLIALIPGAIFVSLINDFTDREDDTIAGKPNRLVGKPVLPVLTGMAICLIAGSVICFFFETVTTLSLYLGAWISYTLYSVPPFRMKKRGFWGVLTDALGANVFPQLFAISAMYDWFDRVPHPVWFSAVGTWSLFWGLRGIIWHQLKDRASDEKSGTSTFIRRHSLPFVKKLSERIFFPAEILSFLIMIFYARAYPVLVLLGFYLFLEWLRYDIRGTDIVILLSGKEHRVLMLEYYCILYPFGFLITGMDFSIGAMMLLAVHLLVFFRGLKTVLEEAGKLLKEFIRGY